MEECKPKVLQIYLIDWKNVVIFPCDKSSHSDHSSIIHGLGLNRSASSGEKTKAILNLNLATFSEEAIITACYLMENWKNWRRRERMRETTPRPGQSNNNNCLIPDVNLEELAEKKTDEGKDAKARPEGNNNCLLPDVKLEELAEKRADEGNDAKARPELAVKGECATMTNRVLITTTAAVSDACCAIGAREPTESLLTVQ
ncbi:hypothetical protein J6590_105771 [Homalodisca vitripennis]|nr:hypothetical protein J6590_105771 [Homalodisca vitripennis]